MNDSFASARYSVNHAKRHLAQLEIETETFFDSNPYAEVFEPDVDPRFFIFKYKLVKPMPEAIPGIAFDAFNSLRSALDQAGFAVAIAGGYNGKSAHFPFGDTPMDVESLKGRGSKQIHPAIFDLMVACKPYKGGNDLLWALNKVCNAHKHEIVTPMASYVSGLSLDHFHLKGAVRGFGFPPRWDSAKNELQLGRFTRDSYINYDMKFACYIGIAKIDFLASRPALAVIKDLINIVDGIVSAIEAETRRLGLIK